MIRRQFIQLATLAGVSGLDQRPEQRKTQA